MKSSSKIIFLDADTVDLKDINLSSLEKLGGYTAYGNTEPDLILPRSKNADIIITNKCVYPAELLSKLPQLKLLCIAATGVNNVDLNAAENLKIGVCNVAGYSTTSVAEQTLLFLLALSHRLIEHHLASLHGDWSRSPNFACLQFPFSELRGKTLGILGYGRIGKEVALLAKAFGMRVLIAKLPKRKYPPNQHRLPFSQVLKKSDFVSIHCPLTDETRHLMNKETLSLMKKSAYLLNLSRGPVVDEPALVSALKKNALQGFATDVLQKEPPPVDHPFFDPSIKNKILMTPHVAWASREARQKLIWEIAANIQSFFHGKKRNRMV